MQAKKKHLHLPTCYIYKPNYLLLLGQGHGSEACLSLMQHSESTYELDLA